MHLLWVSVGALLPLLVFTTALLVSSAREAQREVLLRLRTDAESMGRLFEHEVSSTLRVLSWLAGSERLEQGDLPAFEAAARRVVQTQPSWSQLLLLSPDGQVLGRAKEGGAHLERAVEPASLAEVLRTRAPVVGRMRRGPNGGWGVPVRVPVLYDGEVRYVLTAVLGGDALAAFAADPSSQGAPVYTRTVVDGAGVVVARSRDPQRFVGERATDRFLQMTHAAMSGVYQDTSLEGRRAYVSYFRSARWGWVFAVVESKGVIDAPVWKYAALSSFLAFLSVVASLVLAALLAARLRRGIGLATAAAEGLARGERVEPSESEIAELDRLGALFRQTAALLAERNEDREQHRQSLEQAVRARDEFLSLASHELKTPLTSLMLLSHRLEAKVASDSAVSALLESIRRQLRRINRLVDDLLDTSRIQSGKLRLQREPVDLASLARGTAERLWAQVAPEGPPLEWSGDSEVRGEWDPDRLEQLLTNLLTNCARYAPGAPVRVRVVAEGEQAVLEVSDRGPGISPENQARIFEKFERATGVAPSGLGLGLFIVKSIVQQHGGSVTLLSREGEGSTFRVRLPRHPPEEPT